MASFYVTGRSVNESANQTIPHWQTIAEFAIDKRIVTRGMKKKKKNARDSPNWLYFEFRL